jgi:arsenate reductase-like glutaredoxin family protein
VREFLSQHQIPFVVHEISTNPLGPKETRQLVQQHQKLWVKVGSAIHEWDLDNTEITDDEIQRYLIHRDGRLRVPVISRGSLLIRGFTEALYRPILLPDQQR